MTRSASERWPVAVIGAGPYGLSATAHLRAAGASVHVLGTPMEFWAAAMPVGMMLRSAWEASHIADPAHELTLDRYAAWRGRPVAHPIQLDDFLGYGRWFAQRTVPDTDPRRVREVKAAPGGGFLLELESGETARAERVVVASGPGSFARRPAPFDQLPPELASHASDDRNLSRLAGGSVLVVGSGQSALECAALLVEAGAQVELLARAPAIRWLRGGPLRRRLGPLRPLVYPSTDVGPPGLNHVVGRPPLLRTLPPSLRERAVRRSVRPAGAEWLHDRLSDAVLSMASLATSAEPHDGRVRVRVADDSVRLVDHVLLCTGYAMDVSRCGLLAPDLRDALTTRHGLPRLSLGLESSVPGLHFVGAFAEASHGPVMRFVSGTGFASRAITRSLRGRTIRRTRHARPPRPARSPATVHGATLAEKQPALATRR